MCNGFGCIVDRKLDVWFVEPDLFGGVSHFKIKRRLSIHYGYKADTLQGLWFRGFTKVEFHNWTAESFCFDEPSTLPAWVEENRAEIQDRCIKVLERVAPIYFAYVEKKKNSREINIFIRQSGTRNMTYVRDGVLLETMPAYFDMLNKRV